MSVRVVLLDLDDTLYDHTATSRRATESTVAMEPALAAAGLDAVQAENLRQLADLHVAVAAGTGWADDARIERWRRILERFGGATARAEELAMHYRAVYHRHESPVDGALDLLRAFAEQRIAIAIVSNTARDEQVGKLERLGFAPFIQRLIVSADHGISKPDPRLFQIALRSVGETSEAAVHLGDSWTADVAGARAAGIRAIWFDRTGRGGGAPTDVPTISSLRPSADVVRLVLDG